MNKAILNKADDCITHVLLYGEVSNPFTQNTNIFNTSVEYILVTELDASLVIDN